MTSNRVVPNFFVIGAQKAGTTFLCHHLLAHEKVSFSKRKETFFFGKKKLDKEAFEEYLARHFAPQRAKPGASVFAEGSATYFQSTFARKNMRRLLGEKFKVLVSLRDPVSKTLSWYMHNYIRGRFDASHSILDQRLIRRSRYATHVARWLRAIGPERFKVITYDTLKEDPLKFVNSALEYLELKPFEELAVARVNAGFRIVRRGDYLEPLFSGTEMKDVPVPRFSLRDIAKLHDMLREDIARTQSLTGLDLSRWLEPPTFEEGPQKEKAAA
jgi:hypothetical protein